MEGHSGTIVVGYDGTPQALAALDWAAAEAKQRDMPLTVLHAVGDSATGPYAWIGVNSDRARATAQQGAQQARQAGAPQAEALTVAAGAAEALLQAGKEADRLVIGTRGHGDVMGAVLGSVAFAVSSHATCPVTVVRASAAHPGPDRPILVGVDGSAAAMQAVRHAAALAAATHAPLRIVCAYRSLASQPWAEAAFLQLGAEGRLDADNAARQAAVDTAKEAEQEARTTNPEVAVTTTVTEGRPADVLTASALDPVAMVVVGSRGRGGFTGLLLGSVGHALIHTAPCPVTVVHSPRVPAEVSQAAPSSPPQQIEQSGIPSGLL